MAECHPVAFQWVMEAKARGATVIHVDPRFSRTSAVCDLYVPIRAGADIAFVGGLINYVLQNEAYFRDYLLAYTNAATIVTEDYADTEDLDGVFSGLNAEHRFYDFDTWRYQGGQGTEVKPASGERDAPEPGERQIRSQVRRAGRGEAHGSGGAAASANPDTDETLQHPRCVFQVLKRHFARYTPDMVEQLSGVPKDQFARVCRLVASNSGRDRTTAFVYSLGWTQHTVGVQYIRTAAILQSLLGNMGRPGGGIIALRGHASIQGSTDIPTLFDLLPGYLPMPHAYGNDDLDGYVRAETVQNGFWANTPQYLVSLLKAWWGEAATAGNDFCYDYLPRLTGSHSTYETVLAQIEGTCRGYFLFGQNPAVGSANARMQRLGLSNLDWLVVRDLVMIESATWWKDGPEIETGEVRTADIGTEVFFLPAAAHTEKAGSFTNTQRLLQWRHQAVEPAGDARSDLWFAYHLGRLAQHCLPGRGGQLLPDPPAQVVHEPEVAAGISGGLDRGVMPLQHALGVGEAARLLGVRRGGQEEHLGLDVLRAHLLGLDLRSVLPERRALDHDQVPHHQPVQVGQAHPLHPAVRRTDRRVLPEQEVTLAVAVDLRDHGLVGAVAAGQPRQVVETEVIGLGSRVAPP